MYDNSTFIPQGWQCPVCKTVYSPSTTMCLWCGRTTVTNVPTTETKIDYIYKTMIGDTPETMKQIGTDGKER